MGMKIQIQTAANGWFIEVDDPDAGDKEKAYYVFSYHDMLGDDGKAEADAFAALLWEIKTLIGPQESRYSKHRVMIQIEPGDKSDMGAAFTDEQDDPEEPEGLKN